MSNRRIMTAVMAMALAGALGIWRWQERMEAQPWYPQWEACIAQLGPAPNLADMTGPRHIESTSAGWVLHGRADGVYGETAYWRAFDFRCVVRGGRITVEEVVRTHGRL